MRLTVHTDVRVFDVLRSEWNELLRHSSADMIFMTWEWHSTWWDAYEPGQLWVVTCRDDEGRLLGIAPWFIDADDHSGRVVRYIGSEDVTDYLDVIIHREYTDIVYNCLSEFLHNYCDDYDRINLVNIPQDSPTRTQLPHGLQNRGFQTEVSECEVSPIIRLSESWDEYLSNLDRKQRHEIRRKLRRMNGVQEPVEWHIVEPSQHLEEALEAFMELMASSDPEKEAFLQNPQHVAFFKNFAEIANERGWLQLSFLKIGGEPVAAYFSFDYNKRILLYNSGQSQGKYSNLGTGVVLLAYIIEHAIEQGYEVFDFLRGNETYKYRMGGQDTVLYRLQAELMPQDC